MGCYCEVDGYRVIFGRGIAGVEASTRWDGSGYEETPMCWVVNVGVSERYPSWSAWVDYYVNLLNCVGDLSSIY